MAGHRAAPPVELGVDGLAQALRAGPRTRIAVGGALASSTASCPRTRPRTTSSAATRGWSSSGSARHSRGMRIGEPTAAAGTTVRALRRDGAERLPSGARTAAPTGRHDAARLGAAP